MYKYDEMQLLTDDGFEIYNKILKKVQKFLSQSGAFKLDNVINGVYGDSFLMLTSIDYMEKKLRILKIYNGNSTQERVYIKGDKYEQ